MYVFHFPKRRKLRRLSTFHFSTVETRTGNIANRRVPLLRKLHRNHHIFVRERVCACARRDNKLHHAKWPVLSRNVITIC